MNKKNRSHWKIGKVSQLYTGKAKFWEQFKCKLGQSFISSIVNVEERIRIKVCYDILLKSERHSRLSISKNICERLLFDCFIRSMLHGPKGSRSRLYEIGRLQALSQRSRFLLLRMRWRLYFYYRHTLF